MKELKNKIETFFSSLSFEEGSHSYFVEGKRLKLSVSKIVERYKFPTDWTAVKLGTAAKTGKTPEQLELEWLKAGEDACALGTTTHLFGEKYPFNRTLVPSSPFEEAIVKFWNDLPDYIIPLKLEVQMYHKKFLFAGTADILLFNTLTKEIYILDYKTNKDLFKNFKLQRMQTPFHYMLDMPFSAYVLQLSLYQVLLEQIPGIKVSKRRIIWLKPNATYELYDTEDCTELINKELPLIFN